MKPLFVCLIFLTAVGVQAGRAQSVDLDRSRYSTAAYFNYAEPGDVTVRANVWGVVRNPGLYEVPEGTHLSTLLSVSGGPVIAARSQVQDRTVYVRLYRDAGGERQVVYEAVMENEILATSDDPLVQDGDILTVEMLVRQRLNWRDVFPIVAAVASVALAIERIAR